MERQELIQKLFELGWIMFPIEGKKASEDSWQRRTVSHPASAFSYDKNVGLVLGDASGGIVDVDLDIMAAVEVAKYFLPPTNVMFGRKSKPLSHWLYRVSNPGPTSKFSRRPKKGEIKKEGDEKDMIVELRGNGGYTMIPPSIHPDYGEEVTFASEVATPTDADWDDLDKRVHQIAIAAVLKPHWSPGRRHQICLALTGILFRAGWREDDAAGFVERLATAFEDEERSDRLVCVSSTYKGDHAINGWGRLVELLGEEDADLVCRWIGYKKSAANGGGSSPTTLKTELDCAKAFADHYEDRLLYSYRHECWLERRHGICVPVKDLEIQGLVTDLGEKLKKSVHISELGKFTSARGIKNIMTLAKSELGVAGDDFDENDDLVGCRNGVLDLSTGEFSEHPNGIVTRRIGAIYDPDAECPTFRRFLTEIFDGDKEMIGYMQRCLGYCLQGGVQEQCMFLCVGSGRNGKSTLMNVIGSLFGDYAGTLPMAALMESRFGNQQTYDLASLPGRRFVVCQEGQSNDKLAEAKVKMMTGGDRISARGIYKDPIEFRPNFKLWLATNELPKIEGTDEAIWRRLKNVIRFPVTIPEGKVDLDLPSKLAKESSGVLNFVIEGYRAWREKGLARPASVEEEFRLYRAEADSVASFIEACCITEPNAKESSAKLYAEYARWCQDSSIDPMNKNNFCKTLGKKGFSSYPGRQGNGWRGLRVKTDDDVHGEVVQLRKQFL